LETHDYVLTARRHWLLIIGTAVGLAIIAGLGTTLVAAEYVSSSRVFLTTSSSDPNQAYQGGLFSAQRVNSYADLTNSIELSQRVIDQLHLDTTPEQLSASIQTKVVPNTVVMRIDVTDPSRSQAQRINGAVVQQLQRLIREFETPPGQRLPLLRATAVGSPNVTSSPTSPNRVLAISLGFALGLLLGFGIAILRDLMGSAARRSERSSEPERHHAAAAAEH
jgi:capsular polysaccharide biosynthesis protein